MSLNVIASAAARDPAPRVTLVRSRTVANVVTFGGDVRFDNTGTSAVTLTLNGGITLASGTMGIKIASDGTHAYEFIYKLPDKS